MQRLSVEEDDKFFDSFDKTPASSCRCSVDMDMERELECRKLDSEFWEKDLMSVQERRRRFLLGTGLNEFVSPPLCCSPQTISSDTSLQNVNVELERVTEGSGAALDSLSYRDNGGPKDLVCCIRDLDSGKEFVVHDVGKDGLFSMLKEVGSNNLISLQEFEALLGLSRSVQRYMRKEAVPSGEKHLDGGPKGKIKKRQSWWKRLVPKRPLLGMCKNDASVKDSKLSRVKVLRHKKKCLEFSALYVGQEIQAHKGVIRTMKFSPSGCYLASGGEDSVIRIWQVREAEASCKCSSANCSCDFVTDRRLMRTRKDLDFAPVVIPKKVFMIDDTPLHQFHGHSSEILDLSWSSSDCLLSSSMDKTIRLWKVGCVGCLKVFQHNDYVTCVQFNPADDKYFISGSIDGIVRIWSVSENLVADWADIREIVTAVCYRPDGEGFAVGSITGNCRFYDYSGDAMQLEAQFCAQGMKKSFGRPITGLQFSPEDSQRVMITSVDTRVRIFNGVDVIQKLRGLRKTKSQLSTSFTTDGRYIISVGEDSNVYIWNYDLPVNRLSKRPKSLKSMRSCELFSSDGALIAIPWPGINRSNSGLSSSTLHLPSQPLKILEPSTWLWDSDLCSLGAWLFADGGVCKGSATWPEEKLPISPRDSVEVDDRQYRQYHHLTHLSASWNMVIVTATCHGTIRSFHNYGLPVS